jgi:site-specific DNA-methyltransferase (adenine-specific)
MTTDPRALPLGQIQVGDARDRLDELPPASVDCVITSPPYFGLRDYGHPRQLGLERDVDGWVADVVGVCDQLARVLKPGGSLWLNVGDGYSAHPCEGAPKKSLLLGPQRLAVALVQVGWSIRNQVIWAKTNPLPSSVMDRFSCGYEVLLLLVRSRQYFFDLDAIRQPLLTRQPKRPSAATYQYLPDQVVPPSSSLDDNLGLNKLKVDGRAGHPLGKNPGDVWQLPTAGYRGAHFATFPLTLVERPLLAACPERVCGVCGQPWVRQPVDRRRRTPRLRSLSPDCACHAATVPGVVLDPFMGAGTVAVAAEMHGRDWVGIELNPSFVALAERRIKEWREDGKPKHNKEDSTWSDQ